MQYYIVQFNNENIVRYAIWYTDEKDGFVCESGKILFFDSVEMLKEFCDSKKNVITDTDEMPFIYDFDYLKNWLKFPDDNFDCSNMLDFWNIISDALNDMGIHFIGDCKTDENVNKVYDKLYYGCNLPAYNKNKMKYTPEWTKEEIDILQKVLSQYEKIGL